MNTKEIQDVISKLNFYHNDLKNRWDQMNPHVNSWWKFSHTHTLAGVLFIIEATDELVQFIEPVSTSGPDKKFAVLSIISTLFDYVVAQAYPFWLKPFAPIIKTIVVGIIVNCSIDYIVEKYNAGFWKMEYSDGKKI